MKPDRGGFGGPGPVADGHALIVWIREMFMESRTIVEVFLLADNRLLREALIRILTKKSDIRIVGAAPFSPDALEEIKAVHPNIVLLDSLGPVFSEAKFVTSLLAAIPGVRVAMIDMELDQQTFLRAVREGVVGYVLKDASATEVAATIRAVSSGEAVCPASLSMSLFNLVKSRPLHGRIGRELSRREAELVTLLREGLTNKEIATRLHLSEQTVKNHVHRILRKVGVQDRLAVVEHYDFV
jgi:DNA-binding NarL/FixJ family response regulator